MSQPILNEEMPPDLAFAFNQTQKRASVRDKTVASKVGRLMPTPYAVKASENGVFSGFSLCAAIGS